MSATLSADGRTLSVRMPMTLRKRGGRKLVVTPEGAAWAPERREVDSALVKALARAHRWRRMLETGVYATIGEIAAAERISLSYASRVLRLTLLAPEIVEAILRSKLRREGGRRSWSWFRRGSRGERGNDHFWSWWPAA